MSECGACTVHIDGSATRSCVTPLSAVEAMELMLDKLGKTKSNADFLGAMQKAG